ncbi:hypothetical protein [Treponema succinifaciens]|nr:hypothetical protein [Treponema succinifaciens]MDY5117107.1 hypothetical protein [Treponema succinifaciens]
MKLFGRKKARKADLQFDPETQYAVIRSSADETEFKETYGVDSLKVEY